MKEVNSIFKIITLLICICVISHHNVNAQCVVVDQGPAAAPTCNYQSVSGGAGAYWEINTSAGVYYSFYWNGSGCPSNTNQFCINGLGSTATGGAPYNVQSGGGSWNIGFYEIPGSTGAQWCGGGSSVLNYKIITPTATGSGSATVCASTSSYTISGFSAANGNISWSTSGDGTFSNTAIANPIYTFGASDRASGGAKTLTMTVNNGGCIATAVFTLTIDPVPIATAGGTSSATVCANTTSYAITGYSSANGTISWSTTGDGSFTGGNTANPTYHFGANDLASGGTKTLTMTVSDGGVCTAATTTFSLTIDPTPTATAGSTTTATVCGTLGHYIIPAGYSSTNGTISWTTSGDGAFTSGATTTTPTYTFGAHDQSVGGIITLTMKVTGGVACTPPTVTFTLIIDPLPTASIGSTSSATICSSANAYNIPAGYTATNGTIAWTTSGDGTFTNGNTTTPTYTFGAHDQSVGGTITLTMTVSNAACTPATATFALTIDPAPVATAGATSTAHACITDGQFVVPSGYSSTNGTISWSSSGDGAFISGGNTTTPTYFFGPNDQTTGGLIILTMTVTGAAVCTPATATFALIIDQQPVASPGATSAATACGFNNTYSIPAGYTATYGTISWSTSGDGTFTNGTSATPTYVFGPVDKATGGVITLTMSVTNAGCGSAITTFTLTINPATATAGATSSATVCASSNTYHITGYTAAHGTISWSTSGDGTFTNGTTASPTYHFGPTDKTAGGVITLTMSVTNGPCVPTASFTLTISPTPTATAGATSTARVCASVNAYTIPAGYTSTNGTISWSSSGDGTFTSGATTTTPTYTFGPNDILNGGVKTLTMSVSNAPCTPATATFSLTIDPIPAATAGTTNTARVCATTGAYTIPSGYTSANGTISWSTSGDGTFTSGANTLTPTYTFGPHDQSAGGVITFTMTVTGAGVCPPATATFALTIDPAPIATAGTTTSATVCASAASYTIPVGYTATNGTISWSSSGDGTFTNGTTATPTYTFGITDVANGGVITLTMGVSNTTCAATNTSFSLTIDPIPSATAGTTATDRVCATTGAYTIPSGYSSANGTISWSTSGDGTFTSGANTLTPTYTFGPVDQSAGGVITFTMTVTGVGVCPPATATFALTIDPAPIATAGTTASATVCAGDGSYTIPAGYTATNGTISWSTSGDGTFTNGTTATPTYTFGVTDAANGGVITLTMSVSNPTCAAANATFSLTIDQVPTTATTGPTQNICGLSSSSLGGNTPTVGAGLWSQISGSGTTTFSNPTDPSSTATASVYDTYIYTWTVSNGVCAPSVANVTVNFWANPTPATVGTDELICGLTSDSLGGNIPAIGTGVWSQTSGPGTSTFSSADSASAVATATAYGTYVYTWTISNGNCTPTTANISVTYYMPPTTATVGPNQGICGFSSNSLGGNTPAVGTGVWTQFSGPGTSTFSNASDPSSTATASTYGTYIYAWTITNGVVCTPSVAYDTVTYFANPTTATVGTNQSLCGLSSNSLGGNTPTIGTGIWTQTSGPGTTTFSNPSDPAATATVSDSGTYVYTWTITNGPCTPSTANISVTLYGIATVATVPANQSVCGLISGSLGGNTPTTGTGTWAQVSGPGTTTFSNINDPSATATVSVFGTYVYTWTIATASCTSNSANETVTFFDNPTPATVGADQNICGLKSLTLGGNTPIVGTGAWTQTSGPGITIFSNPTSPASTATAAVEGTYVYTWTISNGACTPSTANMSVFYFDTPTVATVGANQNICASLTSNSLGANTPTAGTGQWTQASGPGTTTFSNPGDPAATATASTYGTYVYKWTISNGPCTSSTANITVNYYNNPTTATVGPTQNICASLISASLGGNSPTVGTGLWSQTSGPGTTTFSNASNPASTATATAYGTYVYTWTISNGSCPPSTASITVNYYNTPTTATTGPADNVCALTSDPLTGNTPTIGVGTWTQVSGPGTTTFSNANSGTSTATATVVGTYVYAWTISNGNCTSSTANQTVNYFAMPTTATVGPDQNLCASLISTSLGGNTPTVGTGLWSQTSGPGTTTFSNNTDPLSTATASVYGTYVYTWTITNGVCPPSTASITVNYYNTPTTATAGPNQNICASLITAPLGGNTPAIGTGLWTQTSGPGTTTFSNSGSGSSTATASVYGTYVYTWTISNGNCPTTSANVTVNFYDTPTPATVGSTQNVCASLTSPSLGGNTPTVGTGLWTQTSGPGTSTFSNNADPLSTATASVYGTYMYTWTISNGNCPTSAASITVNYYDVPTTATTGPTQNICASLISASLGGNTPVVGTGVWTQTSGPGTSTFSNSGDPLSTATASVYGTYVYTWTITNGTCPPSAASETVNFYNTPTPATVGATQNVCGLTSNTLGGNTPSIGTGVWTQTSGPGTSTFSNASSGSSTATATVSGTYVYTWTISNGNCTPSTASITVTYYDSPTPATVGATQNLCASLTSGALGGNTPTIGAGVWTQTSGPGTTTFSNTSDPASTATASIYGTYIYTWTISNGPCPPSTASVTVNYYATPTTATVGAAQSVCGLTSNSLGGNTPVIGTGLWTQTSGPGTSTFSNASDPAATATVSVQGTYTYTWTITNGTCPPSSAIISVTYYAVPTTATVGPTQGICGVLTSDPLGANTPVTGTGSWSQTSGPGTSTFSNASDPAATATVSVVGTYVFTWTISNGVCPPSTAPITVNYILMPSGGGISHISYCASAGSGTLNVTGVSNVNQYQWSLPSGLTGSSILSSISVSGTTAGGYTVTVTPENIAFGTTCSGPSVTGTVTVFAMPVISSVNPGTLPCFGINNDTLQINATTANGNLSYSINNGATYAYDTSTFPNLGPGTYNIVVVDDSSCTTTYTANPVTLAWPPQLVINTLAVDNVVCNGAATGDITVSASGGSPGYSYRWSNTGVTPAISGLSAGVYTVTVTDSHFCTATEVVSITQSSPLLLNASKGNVLCPPLQNGWINLPVSGGLPPYNFFWDSGQPTSGLSGLDTGTYHVTVTDSGGCTIDTSFVIINDNALSIRVVPDTASINEGDLVQLGIDAISNGAGNIQYTWTPVAGLSCTDCPDPNAAPTQTTEYIVQAISDSGCVATSYTTITVDPQHQIYVPNAFSPNNDGINDYWEIYGYKKAWVYLSVEIFDRWGEKIFESHDIDFKWDGTYRGTPVVIGVYTYILTVVNVDGFSTSNHGAITIIK